jgi:hypothetical protein
VITYLFNFLCKLWKLCVCVCVCVCVYGGKGMVKAGMHYVCDTNQIWGQLFFLKYKGGFLE